MSIEGMINSARHENPSKFEDNFNSVVAQKMSLALQDKKAEVVAKMFNIPHNIENISSSNENENNPE